MSLEKRILIANRGEIALRILKTAQTEGYYTIVGHSTADAQSLPVRLADSSICLGQSAASASYLNADYIMMAAKISKADAIHPGYGFLAEQPILAQKCSDAGLIFIGPSVEHLILMGDKKQAKNFVRSLGVPCIPDSEKISYPTEKTSAEILTIADEVGFPLLIKATAGGGGKGMRIVSTASELLSNLALTQEEAFKAYGEGTVYFERYLSHPRHIEVQILGSGQGDAVHFGMRECSIQRRYQKIIEEGLPVGLDENLRSQLYRDALGIVQALKYSGLGTLEFLYQDGRYYFIEMNTRIQVEHPVSEMICSEDLVAAQLDVAFGRPWRWKQENIMFKGHAIECRINAECPFSYQPRAGKVSFLHWPHGIGVRVDSALYQGCTVSPFYDSLIGKVIVWAPSRSAAIEKMKVALRETIIEGITTNLPLLRLIFEEEDFCLGEYNTQYLHHHRFFEETIV